MMLCQQHIDEYCTSTFCPACGSRMEKFYKIDDPRLKNPKHKDHIAMAVAAVSDSIAASITSAAVSVAAAATAVSVATKTAANAASITESAQQSHNQWMPIRPQSADIIRWIGDEKGWSKDKIDSKIRQQVQDEKAERNQKQCVNIQPADNLKRIVKLSGWSQGKIERKIRQRIRDELAAQQQNGQQQQQQDQEQEQEQQATATGVNIIPAVETPRQILCHSFLQYTMEDCLQTFRADGTKTKDGEKVPSGRRKWNNRDMAAVLNFRIILNALLTDNRPPHSLRKKASSELAEAESTVTPETLLKPKPKRVRKNPSSLASSLQKKQRTD
ncbi:hypothetical protein LPJ66_003911 [Kickxella alabastrina]|uniref:Uncharacterized protein n=1 Tax=Kickxella alabastrina TaxID=61397 RepID=A0ACC1IJE0_9FUNG|nr:hypothetical protein LPJ66_003911 [Kickxella alabastrina]